MKCKRCHGERAKFKTYCESCAAELKAIALRAAQWRKRNWTSASGQPVCRWCARMRKPDLMRTSRMCWECYRQRAKFKRDENPEATRARNREWRRRYRTTERGKRSEIEAVLRWRANHHDEYLASQRDRQRRNRADPERHQRELEDRRIRARLRREALGLPVRLVPPERYANGNGKAPYARGQNVVLTAPIAPYIKEWLGPEHGVSLTSANRFQREGFLYGAGLRALAELAGVDERRVYSVLHQEYATVHRDIADRILTAIGIPFRMVYPS